jgi:hypothetical protein
MKNSKKQLAAMFTLTCLFAANLNAATGSLAQEKKAAESTTLSPSCPTDINNDGVTSQADLNLLLAKYGQSCTCPEDINQDGVVSAADFNLLLLKFGTSCN